MIRTDNPHNQAGAFLIVGIRRIEISKLFNLADNRLLHESHSSQQTLRGMFCRDNFIGGHFADEKTVGQIKSADGLRVRVRIVDNHRRTNDSGNPRAFERLKLEFAQNFVSDKLFFVHAETFFLEE